MKWVLFRLLVINYDIFYPGCTAVLVTQPYQGGKNDSFKLIWTLWHLIASMSITG